MRLIANASFSAFVEGVSVRKPRTREIFVSAVFKTIFCALIRDSLKLKPLYRRIYTINQRLNICLLGYRSNPYSGGQGIYIRYLSKALIDAGHNVDVISGPPYPDLDPRVKLIKLPSLDLFESENHVTALRPKHLLSFSDFFEWLSMLTGGFPEPYTFGRRLVRHFRREKPQYDIVHDNQSLCYGTLQLQKMGVPLVTTIHHPITSDLEIALQNAETWQLKLLIRRWHNFLTMQKKVTRQLHHLVTVSAASRDDIAVAFDVPANRIDIVHNGIDTEIFKPRPEIVKEPLTLMTTASADAPLKGTEYLFRALALLAPDYPDLKLILLGKLEVDGVANKLIDRLGIRNRIEFHSGLSTDEVVRLYARATIAITPSIYEGFGLPAGEAMACGVPVVSTNGGALPEIVGDCGLITPVRDHVAIAQAISSLLKDEPMRSDLSVRGRERILKFFNWNVAAQDMVKVYSRVLGTLPQSALDTEGALAP